MGKTKAKAIRKAAKRAKVPVATLKAMTPLRAAAAKFTGPCPATHVEAIRVNPVTPDEARGFAQFAAELGFVTPADKDRFAPGTFGAHEALDRCSLLAAQVEEWLLAHPTIAGNAEWREKVGHAAALLHEVYQSLGAEHVP